MKQTNPKPPDFPLHLSLNPLFLPLNLLFRHLPVSRLLSKRIMNLSPYNQMKPLLFFLTLIPKNFPRDSIHPAPFTIPPVTLPTFSPDRIPPTQFKKKKATV
jgi:hypothetical protein